MCGIAGALDWERRPEPSWVQLMTDAQRHRGPDAEGFVARGPMALGHRRLSIIDTSPAGNQPMTDSSKRLWIVFNGEIYNFIELRKELESRGSQFQTRTDTEVILEAYRVWGDKCASRLNGMFAFALWDEERERLYLARDRIGKKPLYYQPLGQRGIVFASELSALRLHPGVSGCINPVALGQFLSLNYTLTNECIISGVRKLQAGHYLVVDRDGIGRPHSYWDLAQSFRNKAEWRSKQEAAEALGELIDDSVRLRLVSDVPLGAFLSGGIDSASIVAAMCHLRRPIDNHTFSIDFTEDSYSERADARATAAHLGVVHRDRTVDVDAARALPAIAKLVDEPFADTSIIPTYLLAGFAREHVTVCLSGDGGDEIFAGYETYAADRLRHRSGWLPAWSTKAAGRAVEMIWPVSFKKVSFDYKLRRFLAGHALDERRAHYFWREIFSPNEKMALVRPDERQAAEADPFPEFERHFDEVRDCDPLDQAMYVDIKTWLVDDIMVKVDRATMAHSLEARAPLLDYRLVEFAASLPVSWKLKGVRGKHLLRKSQAGRLPQSALRRPKRGFNAPVSHWLDGGLASLAQEVTTDPIMDVWFNRSFVDGLWREHHSRAADNGLKLFGLTCLGLWMSS